MSSALNLVSVGSAGESVAVPPRPGLEVALVAESFHGMIEQWPLIAAEARSLPRPFQQVVGVEEGEAGLRVVLERFTGVDAQQVVAELQRARRVLPLEVWLAIADRWLQAARAIRRDQKIAWRTTWMPHQFGIDLRGEVTLSFDELNHVLGHWPIHNRPPGGLFSSKLPFTLSPEQARGIPLLDASRVHCFGSLFIFLLTFERPFGTGSDLERLQRVIEGRSSWTPTHHPQCTPALAQVLDRALLLDPAQRWQSVEELHLALLAAAGVAPAPLERLAGVAFGANPAWLTEGLTLLESQAEFLPPSWSSGGLKVMEDLMLERLVPSSELPELQGPAVAPAAFSGVAPPRINLARAPRSPWWRRLFSKGGPTSAG